MPHSNPYAPPTAEALVKSAPPPEWLQGATGGQRFLHFILDHVGFYVFFKLLIIVTSIISYFLFPDFRNASEEELRDWAPNLALVFLFGGYLLYYAGFEAIFQRTPAKFLTGTKIVRTAGGRPTFQQILSRSLTRLVPFEAFTFLDSERPVGLHDSWSGTRVVRTRGPNAYEG